MALNFLEARQIPNRAAAGLTWGMARRMGYSRDEGSPSGFDEAAYNFFNPADQSIDATKVTEFEAARTFVNDKLADHTLEENPARAIYEQQWSQWFRLQSASPDLG